MDETEIENRAVALYTVASYDIEDFIDMLREREKTSVATLTFLHEMLTTPCAQSDMELNSLLAPMVMRELEKRVLALSDTTH